MRVDRSSHRVAACAAFIVGAIVLGGCSSSEGEALPEATGDVAPFGARAGHASPSRGAADSGGDPGTLTCDWLRSKDNCWPSIIEEIRFCLPPGAGLYETFRGKRGTECQYLDGSIGFIAPTLPWHSSDEVTASVDLPDWGGTCFSFEAPVGSQDGADGTVVLSSMTRTATLVRGGGITTITCPQTTVFTGDEAAVTKECHGFPGIALGKFVTTVDLVYGPTSQGAFHDLRAFDCR